MLDGVNQPDIFNVYQYQALGVLCNSIPLIHRVCGITNRLWIPRDHSSLPTIVTCFNLGTNGLQTNINTACVFMCKFKFKYKKICIIVT